MDKPFEEARYLASWLVRFQDKFIHLLDDQGFYIDEDALVEEIDEYFNSRR